MLEKGKVFIFYTFTFITIWNMNTVHREKREKREKACKVATASGGASERVPAPMVPFFVLPFMSSCVLLRSVDSLRLPADLG